MRRKSQAVKGRFKEGPSQARQNQNRFQNASRFEAAEKQKLNVDTYRLVCIVG
jgi:hypothetical protein